MRYRIVSLSRTCLMALAVTGASLLVLAGVASAETYKASNTEQFVEAVSKANANSGPNTILLTSGGYTPKATVVLTNTTGLQTIEGSPSAPATTINGADVEPEPSEVLKVKEAVSVKLKNVVVTTAGGAAVPAIDDSGTLEIERSTLGNNGADVHVEPGATGVITNSTLSDGLDFGLVSSGTTSVINSTVAFNTGGIDNKGTLKLTNSIVAENSGGDCTTKAAATSDHSLDSDGTCGVGSLSKTNPLLQPLSQNPNGATPVHPLKAGSPAIGAGNAATCTATDQRGERRASACSIGAVENYFQFGHLSDLKSPNALAATPGGYTWIADTENNRIVEYGPAQEFIRQVGSQGSGSGQLQSPKGVAVDSKGNVWVVDSGNRRVEEFSEAGVFIRQFGSFGTAEGQFTAPSGIAVDSKGHVWVSDGAALVGPAERIEEFSEEGAFIRQFGTKGFGVGQLDEPQGLAVDSKGNVWVADRWNQRIDEFSETGTFVSKFGTYGSAAGQLIEPQGVAVDSGGNVWVADTGNSRVQEFSEKGVFVSQFGTKGSGDGQLSGPDGVGITASGDLWIADTGNSRVVMFSP
jgi:streptogramin lyase